MTKILVITEPDTTAAEALAPFSKNLELVPYPFATFRSAVSNMKDKLTSTLESYRKCVADGTKAVFHMGYRKDYSKHVPRRITDKLITQYEDWMNSLSDYALLQEFIAMNRVNDEMVLLDDGGKLLSNESPDGKYDTFACGDSLRPCIPTKEGGYVTDCIVRDIKWTRDEPAYADAELYWDVMTGNGAADNFLTQKYGTRHNFALASSRFSVDILLTPDGEWLEAPKPTGNDKTDIKAMKEWRKNFPKLVKSCGTQNVAHIVEFA